MKFFVSTFLLILSLLSFIKIVHSIKCHASDTNLDERPCWDEFERSGGTAKRKLFSCFRKVFSDEKDNDCDEYSEPRTACYTLTYELQDQTQLLVKQCDDPKHTNCPEAKKIFDVEFGVTGFVTASHCSSCSTDNCNDQKVKDKPIPPPKSSLSGVKAPPATPVFIIVSMIHILL